MSIGARPCAEYVGRFETAWESLLLIATRRSVRSLARASIAPRSTQIDPHWHDVRHEGACRLLADGVGIRIIQLMLGPASVHGRSVI